MKGERGGGNLSASTLRGGAKFECKLFEGRGQNLSETPSKNTLC